MLAPGPGWLRKSVKIFTMRSGVTEEMRISLLTKPSLGLMAALALGSLASAQTCPAADAFEPNDDCASANVVTAGSYTGLTRTGAASVLGDSPDFYTVNVGAFSSIQVDLLFNQTMSSEDIDLYLWDAAAATCPSESFGDYLVRGFTGSSNETVTWTNNTGSAVDYIIGIDAFSTSLTCLDYDLDIIVTSLLSCPGADSFEPNDDCASASVVTDGSYPFLSRTGPANVSEGDSPDFFVVTVPAQTTIDVDLLFANSGGDIDVYLWDTAAATCGLPMGSTSYLVRGFTGSDNESISWDNTSAAAVDYTIGVDAFGSGFDCNDYTMDITFTSLIIPVCPAADAFEPNDDCASASAMTVGLTEDLTVYGPGNATPNEDFWSYTMVNNEAITIDVLFSNAGGDIDVYLYDDAACANQVGYGGSVSDNEQLTYTNVSGGPVTVTMKTRSWGSFSCNDYSIDLSSVIDPCLSVSEDGFAPNQDCASAVLLGDGSYPGLAVFKPDGDDFFAIDVADGSTLNVDLLFLTAPGDIDCYLYDPATLGTTCGDKSDYLVRGFTGSDNESISWTNTSGSTQQYLLQVNLWDSAGNEDCNTYDLVIDIAEPTMGTSMCAGDGSVIPCPCGNESADAESGCLNSTLLGSKITATGSPSVVADDAVFHLSQAPAGESAVLVQGTTQTAFPFKDGIFCMGTFTRRVEFATLDGNGEISTVGSMATEANLFPGQTRWYQWWHRDPAGSVCGAGSNTSNGLEITWI